MTLRNQICNSDRTGLLRKKIIEKGFVRIMEAHNGLSALVAGDSRVTLSNGANLEFDGFWESSLTDSASKGFPDIEVVGMDSRLSTINQILEVTKKPLIVDGDTGGDFNQFCYTVKRLERAGVSMVIIEDKVFPKRNSLEAGTKQTLEKPEVFAEKIRKGQEIKTNPDFMIVARIESLIAGHGIADAIERAKMYLEAGVDGIMIHSKKTEPTEILEFAEQYRRLPENLTHGKVLVCVPTTYNSITCTELAGYGFNVIIHANHLLRASYKVMEETCQTTLLSDRSLEVDPRLATVKEIFKKVGFLDVKEKDQEVSMKLKSKLKLLIPAAGKNELAEKVSRPLALLDINGKSLLERQLEIFAQFDVDEVALIRGFQGHLFELENIQYFENPDYERCHIAESIFQAEKALNSSFIYLHSDILLNPSIAGSLAACEKNNDDIILVVDNSFQYHKHDVHKKLDLVRTNRSSNQEPIRTVNNLTDEKIQYIGKNINKDVAHYEFIGAGYFSERGAQILKKVYYDLKRRNQPAHESKHFSQNSFTDLIQEVVNQGYPVKVLKTYQGWMEVHNEDDLNIARTIYN